jgi:hypothetical protein
MELDKVAAKLSLQKSQFKVFFVYKNIQTCEYL